MNVMQQTVVWRKAMRSMGNGNCVEVSPVRAGVAVRDSKSPAGPMLAYSVASWRAFVRETRLGHFDTPNT